MPRTIDEGFRDFLTKLTPSSIESEAAKKHRASIESCLKANFELRRFFRTGSFGNGTSIAGFSDVDYFASIPRDKLSQHSNSTLRKVKEVLSKRFPNTGVGVRCPSVEVPFGILAKESTEVVPADFLKKTAKGYHIYDIPDCDNDWRLSSPDAHNAYVLDTDKRLSGKAKPLIRFIKAWKYFRNVPISSFYLELRVTKYLADETAVVYSIDIRNFLGWLNKNNLPGIQDPTGVCGMVYPCRTDVQLKEARSKLETAARRAASARDSESKEDIKSAFEWWSLLFGSKFPSYYR